MSRREFLSFVTGPSLATAGVLVSGSDRPGREAGVAEGPTGRRDRADEVQGLIDEAAARGSDTCEVPDRLLPYDASRVSFRSSVRMVRESTPHSWYDVMAYGAGGDGADDDQPAIQQAVRAAESSGGGPVWIPAGTYEFDSAVVISTPEGLEVFGDGMGLTRLQKTSDRTDCFRIEGSARDIVVRDLQIDGDWQHMHFGSAIRADFEGVGGDHNIRLFRLWITKWHERPVHFTGVNTIDIIQMKVRDLRKAVFFEQCADARIVDMTVIGAIQGGDNVRIRGGSTLFFVGADFNYALTGNNLVVEDVDGRPGSSLAFIGGRVTDDPDKVEIPEANPPRLVGTHLYADISPLEEFPDGATEPDVAAGNVFRTRNSRPTRLVGFGDAVAGHRISVLFKDDQTRVDFTQPELEGFGGKVWQPDRGDWLEALYDGDVWHCWVSATSLG